jgi:uncharacterized protein (DUF2235 family)
LINNCGILRRPDARRIAEAWKIYKSPLAKHHPSGEDALAFRQHHAHVSREVHFVGVWDTVGALGIPFSLMGLLDAHDEFYDTKMGANVKIARHALAIDEQRQDFEPTVWTSREGVDLKQVWFAGVHSDVGGSYPPDSGSGLRSADIPLRWMLDQARAAGLRVEPHILVGLDAQGLGTLHRSRRHVFRLRSPLHRPLIVPGKPTLIHPSVQARYLADTGYRPPQLQKLVDEVGWEGLALGA